MVWNAILHHALLHCVKLHHTSSHCRGYISQYHTAPHRSELHQAVPQCTTLHMDYGAQSAVAHASRCNAAPKPVTPDCLPPPASCCIQGSKTGPKHSLSVIVTLFHCHCVTITMALLLTLCHCFCPYVTFDTFTNKLQVSACVL